MNQSSIFTYSSGSSINRMYPPSDLPISSATVNDASAVSNFGGYAVGQSEGMQVIPTAQYFSQIGNNSSNVCSKELYPRELYPREFYPREPIPREPFPREPFPREPFSREPFSREPFSREPFSREPFSRELYPSYPCTSNPSLIIPRVIPHYLSGASTVPVYSSAYSPTCSRHSMVGPLNTYPAPATLTPDYRQFSNLDEGNPEYYSSTSEVVNKPENRLGQESGGAAVSVPDKEKKRRTVYSFTQRSKLEETFMRQKYLTFMDRMTLAKELDLSENQVKTWFQNRRTKFRQQGGGPEMKEPSSSCSSKYDSQPYSSEANYLPSACKSARLKCRYYTLSTGHNDKVVSVSAKTSTEALQKMLIKVADGETQCVRSDSEKNLPVEEASQSSQF